MKLSRFLSLFARDLRIYVLTLLMVCTGTSHANAELKVIVTIKPIHSIVSAIMEGVSVPELLVDDLSAPYGIVVTEPRQDMLKAADLVIWTSNSLETSIKDSVKTFAPNAKTLELTSLDELFILPFRDADRWKSDQVHDRIRPDYTGAIDPHIWLYPNNAITIAKEVAAILTSIDPENAETYSKNADVFGEKIKRESQQISAAFEATSYKSYVIFHDAYQYYEHAFDLKPIAAIVPDLSSALSSEHLDFLQEEIEKAGDVCIFYEPQFTPQVVDMLSDGKTATASNIDSVGVEIEAGPDLYLTLLTEIQSSIVECEFRD